MNSTQSRRMPAVLLAIVLGWPSLSFAETLEFKASFRGMLTAYQELAIGDVTLEVEQTGVSLDGEPVMRARLAASSKAYPVVEQFYPYRYEFTSYHQDARSRSLAFERRKETSRLRHDLLLLDWEGEAVRRFGIDRPDQAPQLAIQSPPALIGTLRSAGLPDYGTRLTPFTESLETPPPTTVDRLALLQQIRALPMVPEASRDLTVTDGKEFIHYQVTVARRETIQTDAGPRGAWKVRVEGFEMDRGEERLRHRPVYIWLGDDERRRPLRFVSRNALGTFTVEMQHREIQSAANLAASDEVMHR